MIDTKGSLTITKTELLKRLAVFYTEIKNDVVSANKVTQLIKKLDNSEFTIGFCGHFSAGKSSMINDLIGDDLLPSSPIPTSANLVKVKSGREYARVYYKQGDIIEYPAPYNYDVIKEYCKDGDAVDSIELSHSGDALPKGVTIVDTPGIDSTDEAHRVATESALHLADMLFYMMDYNHVQSELNFQFTKEMLDRQKELYLIVNQIDKHNDSELSFSEFKKSVEDAFTHWNIHPKGIYFTSLRQVDKEGNQLSELKKLVSEKIANKDDILHTSILHSVQQILLEHAAYIDEEQSNLKDKYLSVIEQLSADEVSNIGHQVSGIEESIFSIKQETESISQHFIGDLNGILKNAYLMPFTIRELAKNYLEACQDDFKVGLFFSKQKTDKERQERLQSFYKELSETVSSQLEWHLQEFVSTFLKEHGYSKLNVTNFSDIVKPFEASLLSRIIKPGAGVTGDYVLVYTDDVANEIKQHYKRGLLAFLDRIIAVVNSDNEEKVNKLELELEQLHTQHQAIEELENLKSIRSTKLSHLQSVVAGENLEIENMNVELIIKEVIREDIQIAQFDDSLIQSRKIQTELPLDNNLEELSQDDDQVLDHRVDQTVQDLIQSQEMIKSITGLSTIAKEMSEKAKRLKNNQFTVALFGAFSAGKSSFANALLADKVLPVSPNPTTATINKIKPPSEDNIHGTVVVKVKSEDQLLQDLEHSLAVFGYQINDLHGALTTINKEVLQTSRTIESKEKPHFSFMKAVSKGYDKIEKHLGQLLRIDIDGFQDFVANEEKACFVEWIDLYYDCPITRRGITLVDTPGADSINARHTGVAFDYIKNADAVLFVTYYNHAFSKADREFLIQLGRVKDTFSMDKMFFLINAVDLAHSSEELEAVKDYVNNQLISYGIRSPRMYPISSQLALQEKVNIQQDIEHHFLPSSGIKKFEKDFYAFIVGELTKIAISSGYNDIKRAHTIVESYLESATESKDIKQKKIENAIEAEKKIIDIINSSQTLHEESSIEQEIKELTYYIKQRIFLRYPDFFKEAFNPATLIDDGRDLKKALVSCLKELIESIGFDLAQEMRATSLRVEKYINKVLNEVFDELNVQIKEIDAHIQLSTIDKLEFSAISFDNGLENINLNIFKPALSRFRNPKSFFEKNEKKIMSEEISDSLQSPVSTYLEMQQTTVKDFYVKEFIGKNSLLKRKAITEVGEYFTGIRHALSDDLNLEELQNMKEALFELVKDK